MNTPPAPEAEALRRPARLERAEALTWMEDRLGSPAWLLTIDGRSGSGKTVLSDAVLMRHADAQVLHLDDLYRDWDALPSGVLRARHLVERWHAGERASYLPTRWPGTEERGPQTLEPSRALVVEGCGATWVGRQVASARLWLDVDRETRRRRALIRDGETFAPFWLTWEEQENHWFGQHPPDPDVVVTSNGVTADEPTRSTSETP